MVSSSRRRRSRMLSPTFYLRRTAVQEGLFGGKKAWMVLLVFLYTPRLMRRAFGRSEVLVARERLLPGQFLRVEALPQLSKAEQKAIRRGK